MKTTMAFALCVLLVLVSACAQKVNDPADVQAVRKSIEDYAKAVNAADADAVAALMSDKAYFADNHVPVAASKDAIRTLHATWNSLFKIEFTAPVEEVRVAGDLAVARGTWTIKMTPKAEGMAPITDVGNWIVVLARQGDGTWKWDWCLPNSDQPMPGLTASGEDEQALFQLERDWAAAGLKKDVAVVDKILAKEFVSNFDGRIQNRNQMLAEMKSSQAKIESGVNSDMRVAVFGNTAVVHGRYSEKSVTNGKDTSQQLRYTEVYLKRDGRWQCMTQHVTKAQ